MPPQGTGLRVGNQLLAGLFCLGWRWGQASRKKYKKNPKASKLHKTTGFWMTQKNHTARFQLFCPFFCGGLAKSATAQLGRLGVALL